MPLTRRRRSGVGGGPVPGYTRTAPAAAPYAPRGRRGHGRGGGGPLAPPGSPPPAARRNHRAHANRRRARHDAAAAPTPRPSGARKVAQATPLSPERGCWHGDGAVRAPSSGGAALGVLGTASLRDGLFVIHTARGLAELQLARLHQRLGGGRRVRGVQRSHGALSRRSCASSRATSLVPVECGGVCSSKSPSGAATSTFGTRRRRWEKQLVRAGLLSPSARRLFTILVCCSVVHQHVGRLDVGMCPRPARRGRAGCASACAAASARSGGAHSTHSLQGGSRRGGDGFSPVWSVLAFDLSMGMSLHFQSALRLVVFHGAGRDAHVGNLITRWGTRTAPDH